MRKFLIILAALFCFNVEANEKKSAMMTAKFGGMHSCSLQHLGKNLFITATHCIDFVFERELDNLVPLQMNDRFGLFKIVYYTLDKGVTLTDGLAVIEVFIIDFSDHDIVIIPNKYTEPTNLQCFPALKNGRLATINGKLERAQRLSKTRVVGSGDVGPGCSGGAWLANGNELVGVTSGAWGGSGLGSAIVTVNDSEIINNIIGGYRPELADWNKLKTVFRPKELKEREDAKDRKDNNESIRGIDKVDRGEIFDGEREKKKCTTRHCQPYDRPY